MTKIGTPIRIYHIYEDRIHGAYKYNNEWIVCAWSLPNGFYIKETYFKGAGLDLINEEPYEPEAA